MMHRMTLCVELAAKVRGYFTDAKGKVEIPEKCDGDQELYDLATAITDKTIQPGTKVNGTYSILKAVRKRKASR